MLLLFLPFSCLWLLEFSANRRLYIHIKGRKHYTEYLLISTLVKMAQKERAICENCVQSSIILVNNTLQIIFPDSDIALFHLFDPSYVCTQHISFVLWGQWQS